MFIHADRPLISENGTSTLLHELVHLAQGYSADPGGDWIVEGVAEYYSIEIMRRTGTLTEKRAGRALAAVSRWGDEAGRLQTDRSRGAVTARAVGLLAAVDEEMRRRSGGEASLDDVVRALSEHHERVSVDTLRREAERILGGPLESLESLEASPPPEPAAPP
jgi:predicted metalloprotease with PDZ domain